MASSNLPVQLEDVLAAAERLRGVAHRTPILTSSSFNKLTGRQVFFKSEFLQRSGSFKFRGAYNRLVQLSEEEKRRGVVAFSSGNHAQGVALAAKLLGIAATIVMPSDCPPVKIEATAEYGANVVLYDRLTEDREVVAKRVSDEKGGLTLVPPFNNEDIVAGQGTAAIEFFEDLEEPLDAILIPVGGGGLISGWSLVARSPLGKGCKVYGVEAVGADDVKRSLVAGKIVSLDTPATTIADGIRTTAPAPLTFAIMKELLEDVLVVSDEEITEAWKYIVTRMKIMIEPTAAVGVAAAMRTQAEGGLPDSCKRVGVLLCGGNIDPAMIVQLFTS